MFAWKRVLIAIAVVAALLTVGTGCRKTPEQKKAAFLESGKKHMEKKDFARAMLDFKNAVQVAPKDAEPIYQLGLAYLAMNDIKSAMVCFRKATELDPNHHGAQLKRAEVMATAPRQNIVEDAQKQVKEILEKNPSNLEALNTLAFTELRLGQREDAEKHLAEAMSKFPSHLGSAVGLAKMKLAKRDFVGAEEVLKKAVAAAPKAAAPQIALGELYVGLDRKAEAEQQFRRAIELEPQNGMALLDLAMLHMRNGNQGEAEKTFQRVASLPEKAYKPIYGQFLFQTGRRDQAVKEFERLANADANDRDARTRYVTALLATERTGDAEKVLSAALSKNAKDVDALEQRSAIYARAGRFKEAQTDLTQVIRAKPESAEAHYQLARVHAASGSTENQKQELSEAIRVNPRYLPARLEMSGVLLRGGGAKSALQLLDEAPPSVKGALDYQIQRNWVLMSLDKKDEVRENLKRILAAARVPLAVYQDGLQKLSDKDYAGARAAAEEVLKAQPGNVLAMDLLVRGYAGSKLNSTAAQRVEQWAAEQSKSPAAQMFLGEVRLGLGKKQEARQAFEAAAALNPREVRPQMFLAGAEMADGKLDAARARLSKVVAANGRAVEPRMMLAEIDQRTGNLNGAMEQYRAVLDVAPDNALALNNLAFLTLEHAKKPDEALKLAQQAKEKAPNNAAVDDTLGWVYYQKGMYSAAVRHLESAVAKEGTARRQYHLAMAYGKAGDQVKGRQALAVGLKMNASLPEARVAREVVR